MNIIALGHLYNNNKTCVGNSTNDFAKQRYTTPYLAMVIVFFNHKAYGKMALLVMIHIKS